MTSKHGSPGRREFVLGRLREADGITYDELVREVIAAFPEPKPWLTAIRAVRAVRGLLWSRLVVTEPNESVWLTPCGWQRADELANR